MQLHPETQIQVAGYQIIPAKAQDGQTDFNGSDIFYFHNWQILFLIMMNSGSFRDTLFLCQPDGPYFFWMRFNWYIRKKNPGIQTATATKVPAMI